MVKARMAHDSNTHFRSANEGKFSGVTIALLAFACFPVSDSIVKSMAGMWPATAVAALRFAMGAVVLALIAWRREGRAGFVVGRPWLHVGRRWPRRASSIAFFSAIYVMPLADAVAISFINPILTALFSAWFLKEPMRPAVWIATLIAFGGVLIMLRPNIAAFGWVAVLPLISAFAMAAMIILNRMVSSQRSIWAAQFYIAFWAAIFLTVATVAGHYGTQAMHINGWPTTDVVVRCMIVAVIATMGHFLLYTATMRATAASIAPLVYIQLVLASLISVLIFKDPIEPIAIVGALLIIGSGILIWSSERRFAVNSQIP
ncbi:MAG: DMT family transporter [Parasphingorhabdus sp.]|nr:DMT family transporter [Parasphingorhabdus sp.]